MTDSELKHTPLPWKTYMDDSQIGDAEAGGICAMWRYSPELLDDNREAQANAKLIVKAVNSHQLLVDTLEDVYKITLNENGGWMSDVGVKINDIVKAALKAARGQ